MKYKINYGNRVSVIPKSALDVVKRADASELRVLLCLCAAEGNADEKKLAKLTGCRVDEVKEALSFWRGAGIVEPSDAEEESGESPAEEAAPETAVNIDESEKKEASAEKNTPKKFARSSELPSYTSDELSDILEKRIETATLVDECQNIVGKVFNVHEINVLIGLLDYLELDCEYIMMLLTYCVSIGKKTLHYAEKTAFSLYDQGITTPEQLSEYIESREKANDVESKIRSLFGIGARAYTTKEKKLISAWIFDMEYTSEIIEQAYEVTADATGKGSIPYANSVLERWYSEGLRTLDEIKAARKEKSGEKAAEGSFNTDEFFDAAVKRALGE